MTIRTFSSREFDQFVGEAKRAVNDGPVLITEQGQAAYALLNINAYCKLQRKQKSLAEALTQADADFDVPRIEIDFKPVDLS